MSLGPEERTPAAACPWCWVSAPPASASFPVPACWGRDPCCSRPSLPRNTCCCSLSARGGDTATDVLAGEEAAPPPSVRSRPSALCPVAERWRPELRAAANGPGLSPGPRSRERGACASAAGVCGLRAASGFPVGVAAQLGGISTVGLLPEAGKGTAPASCFALLRGLGSYSPSVARLWKAPLLPLRWVFGKAGSLGEYIWGNVPRGNTMSTQSPLP